uniref:Uncharacterized protein n=1 Tax=Heterorhabditis bacteriophora TaxID=37862 RepID=A0A1I7WN95_HETBA
MSVFQNVKEFLHTNKTELKKFLKIIITILLNIYFKVYYLASNDVNSILKVNNSWPFFFKQVSANAKNTSFIYRENYYKKQYPLYPELRVKSVHTLLYIEICVNERVICYFDVYYKLMVVSSKNIGKTTYFFQVTVDGPREARTPKIADSTRRRPYSFTTVPSPMPPLTPFIPLPTSHTLQMAIMQCNVTRLHLAAALVDRPAVNDGSPEGVRTISFLQTTPQPPPNKRQRTDSHSTPTGPSKTVWQPYK